MRPLFFISIFFVVCCVGFALYIEHDTKRFLEDLGTPPAVDSSSKNILRVHPITTDPNTPRLKDIGTEAYKPPPEALTDQHKDDTTAEVPSEREQAIGTKAPKPSVNDQMPVDTPKSRTTEKKNSFQKTPDPPMESQK